MIRKQDVLKVLVIALSLVIPGAAIAQDGRTKFIDPSEAAPAAGENLSFTLRTGFYSDYEYRGILLYPGVSIQPSAGAFYSLGDYGTIGATVWAHISAEDTEQEAAVFDEFGNLFEFNRNPKFFELDPTVSYDFTYDVATFSVGHIWYTDPGSEKETVLVNGVPQLLAEKAPDTAEFYGGVSLDVIGQPQLTVYYDYRTFEYTYFSLGFSHTLTLASMGEGFNLTPYTTFGFAANANDDVPVYNSNGLVHVNVGVSTSLKMGILQVKPNLTYVFGTDEENPGTGTERTDNKFFFGVDFAYDMSI